MSVFRALYHHGTAYKSRPLTRRICTSTELGTLPDIEEEAERFGDFFLGDTGSVGRDRMWNTDFSCFCYQANLGIELDGVVHPSGIFVDVAYQQMITYLKGDTFQKTSFCVSMWKNRVCMCIFAYKVIPLSFGLALGSTWKAWRRKHCKRAAATIGGVFDLWEEKEEALFFSNGKETRIKWIKCIYPPDN